MNKERSTDSKHRYLDELILTDESATTIDGPIPSYQNGLHWRASVDANPWTLFAEGYRADGVIDGEVRARGTVALAQPSDDQRTVTLFVEPCYRR